MPALAGVVGRAAAGCLAGRWHAWESEIEPGADGRYWEDRRDLELVATAVGASGRWAWSSGASESECAGQVMAGAERWSGSWQSRASYAERGRWAQRWWEQGVQSRARSRARLGGRASSGWEVAEARLCGGGAMAGWAAEVGSWRA
jgi:hypothetical protein